MTTPNLPLKLALPEPTPAAATGLAAKLAANPKELAAWVTALPMASIGETAKQVFGLLRESNRITLGSSQRSQFIEVIEPLVHYLSDNLIRRFIGIAFPLTARYRGVALVARELQVEMANSYKLLALDYAQTNPPSAALAPALHGSLRYLGRSLLQSALTYEITPPQLWHDINRIYAYSEQRQLHQRAIPLKDANQAEHNQSILDIYKKLVLFSISSPSRLQQNQIQRLYQNAQDWAKHGILGSDGEAQVQQAPFIVDLGNDQPPRYLALVRSEPNAQWRFFETRHIRKLVRELARESDDPAAGPANEENASRAETQTGLPRSLIKRLLLIWKAMPKRSYPRNPQQGNLDICLGFAACYELLKLRRRRQRRLASGLPVDDSLMNMKLEGSSMHADDELGGKKTGKSAVWDQNQFISAQTFPSAIVNEAAGSLCLALDASSAAKARVGEVVGVTPRQDAAPMSLGVIRWLKNSQSGVEFGMEMLSPVADPALLGKTETPAPVADPVLLFPAIESLNQPASLLTSTYGYQTGDIVKIQEENGERKARLTQLADTIGVLQQFEFVEIRPEPASPGADQVNLDNVWSYL